MLKDYYQILEVESSASLPQIKKAYRYLAQLYHPDKNNNSPASIARFSEIKRAYEILSDFSKKENYLQQRWYAQSTGKRKKQSCTTPETILKEVLDLEKYISRLDTYRMDKNGLYGYICEILSNEVIEKLNAYNNLLTNKSIIEIQLRSLSHLKIHHQCSIQKRLLQLNSDAGDKEKINNTIEQLYKKQWQEKNKIWMVVILVTILCLIIYFSG